MYQLDLQDTHVACYFDAAVLHERGKPCVRCRYGIPLAEVDRAFRDKRSATKHTTGDLFAGVAP